MKGMHTRASIISVAFLVLITGPFASAEGGTSLILTDAQVSAIRANCSAVQSTLTRIHTNDALNRVHLGQEYETISSKFMAPMNSRVALAKLDGVELAKTTVTFNQKLTEFRSAYQEYEQTLLRALQLKCSDQPVAFFDTVVLAQQDRAEVRDSVVELSKLVTQYSTQVKALSKQPTPDAKSETTQ